MCATSPGTLGLFCNKDFTNRLDGRLETVGPTPQSLDLEAAGTQGTSTPRVDRVTWRRAGEVAPRRNRVSVAPGGRIYYRLPQSKVWTPTQLYP